jgi:hypothetical protein
MCAAQKGMTALRLRADINRSSVAVLIFAMIYNPQFTTGGKLGRVT